MPRVRVLRPHSKSVGIGVYRVGDVYDESQLAAEQKANAGFVEYVDGTAVKSKESREMYDRISVRAEPEPRVDAEAEVEIVGRKGGWYMLSDGSKELGKQAAADRLGVSVEELAYVDSDGD